MFECSALTVADVHVDHQYNDVNLKVSSSLMSDINVHQSVFRTVGTLLLCGAQGH